MGRIEYLHSIILLLVLFKTAYGTLTNLDTATKGT